MIKQRSTLKSRDAALLILIVVGAAIVGTAMWFMRNSQAADRVTVKVDGKVVYSETLDKETEFNAEGYEGGYNRIVVKDGKVSVTEADCPDKVCVNTGEISKSGDTIVCLPHKLVVEIEGSTSETDAVAR